MVGVAQLVRVPHCGCGGWEFESPRSPQEQQMNNDLMSCEFADDEKSAKAVHLGGFFFVS